MATLQQRLNDLIVGAKGDYNNLRTIVTGAAAGTLTGLNTAASNLVAAINGVETKANQGINDAAAAQTAADAAQATADAAAGGGTQINDGVVNSTDAWSSAMISSELAATLSAASADAQAQVVAALEGEDLSDLADAIAAAAAERADLATAASVTTLTATVAYKANASDVYTQAELGDPDTDLIAIWNAA